MARLTLLSLYKIYSLRSDASPVVLTTRGTEGVRTSHLALLCRARYEDDWRQVSSQIQMVNNLSTNLNKIQINIIALLNNNVICGQINTEYKIP